jgi:MATE family multidrug resistance protein
MEERAPLLSHRAERGRKAAGAAKWRWSGSAAAEEARKVAHVALPMAAVSVAQYAVQVASNMMVGHLPGSVLPLSASAIATSLASVSGFSLLVRHLSHLNRLDFQPPSILAALSYWYMRFLVRFLCRPH